MEKEDRIANLFLSYFGFWGSVQNDRTNVLFTLHEHHVQVQVKFNAGRHDTVPGKFCHFPVGGKKGFWRQ